MNTTLTTNELTALKTCLNDDTREGQLADNFSNGGTAEFMEALGWNAQQVGGLISSLIEKGMGYPDDEGVNGNHVDIFWLTEKGVNAVFDAIEAEEAKAEPADAYKAQLEEDKATAIQDALDAIQAARNALDEHEERLRYGTTADLCDESNGTIENVDAGAIFRAYGAAKNLERYNVAQDELNR